jgi:Transposase
VDVLVGRGATAVEACRHIGIAEQTLYRWRKEYGGLKVNQARRMKGNHPAWTAGGLFAGVPAFDDGGVVFMYFNKVDQVFDSEVGECHHAIFGIPINPDDAIFDVHFVSDIEQPGFAFAEIPGDATNRRDVMNLVDVHDQAA